MSAAETRLTLVVMLFVHPGHENEFGEFESSATKIMHRYGGAIERRIRCADSSDESQPYEIHVVTFPDQKSLGRYREDPELQSLAQLRAQAIHHTVIWQGRDLISR
jgi:uncharacterized protein (DUF1330 family)